jgi:5'(3')-deoxyribonucleotidase
VRVGGVPAAQRGLTVKTLYIDMDNTLVDFGAKLDGIDPAVRERYKGKEDELPGLFALMPPMPGALESFKTLAEHFDTYILSTAPWLNPSAWQHKLEWVHLHLGMDANSPAYKRLILSHHKDLNRGDFLVDDRPHKSGVRDFQGEVVEFGSPRFPDWPTVTEYLLARA